VTAEVLNPVDIEQYIVETKNRIANGVKVVTAAEREMKAKRRAESLAYAKAFISGDGSIQDRRYKAEIDTMPLREEADDAEIAFKHAERTAKALEKELFAWQSVNNSVIAMYGAVKHGS
jgi:hypothetical protein